jgi:hypothetical protein
MPSIVHSAASFASRKIAIVSESATEQPTGLVNVQIEYVATVANRDRVARDFYVDAPPPIFPSCIEKNDLQSRRLYMVSRSIAQSTGLLRISANYAGALWRNSNYLLTTSREKRRAAYRFEGISRFTSQNLSVNQPQPYFVFYNWVSNIHNYEWASVNDYTPFIPPAAISALASVESATGTSPFVESQWARPDYNASGVEYNQAITKQGAERIVGFHRIVENETVQYVTPTVIVKKRQVMSEPAQTITIPTYYWRTMRLLNS